jgi:peptide-methionine (S)-S-oxide reductase
MAAAEHRPGEPGPAAEVATLGGGCFWCTEAVFQEVNGVAQVEPGYAGGTLANPTYEQVCTGTTGHAEVVRVVFEPAILAFADLLRLFFHIHDPTTRDRQGHDVGSQYRSIILYRDDAQRSAAEKVIREVEAAKVWERAIVTQVVPLKEFYPAEAYHRDYFRLHPERAYCQLVISPKLAKFRREFASRLRRPAP